MIRLRQTLACAPALVALMLTGCANPIDVEVARQALDRVAPLVLILSPANESDYAQNVIVEGSATDPGGAVRSVEYRVTGALGILREGTLEDDQIDADGAFRFDFAAIDFSGPIVVSVTARDWNDNLGTAAVTLRDPGNPISSLIAEPANKRMVVSWEPVPDATSYTLYWTTDGTLPSVGYGESRQVSDGTSVDLADLRNGALHTFLLRADVGDERTYWSDYLRAIPLSGNTLAPVVRGEYRRIELEWSGIDATDEFVVLRGTSPEGRYVQLSGVIRGSSFTDTAVADDTWYYYRVRPALEGSVTSTFSAAQTFQAPTVTGRVASVQTGVPNHRVRVSDGFAYVAAGTSGVLVMDLRSPNDPRVVRTVPTTDARDVAIAGGHLYVADGAGGLRIFSLATPGMPVQAARYVGEGSEALTEATRVAVAGARAFVIDEGDSVCAIDVSRSGHPELEDRYEEAPHSFHAIAAAPYKSGATVYVTMKGDHEDQGIIELKYGMNGFSREEETYVSDNYWMREIAVHGDLLLVSGLHRWAIMSIGNTALHVLDRSGGLTELGVSGMVTGATADLQAADTTVVAVDGYRLHAYNISDPSAPVYARSIDTPGSPAGVDTDGRYAYVASGILLFQSVDLRVPTSPVIEGTLDGNVAGAAVRDGFAYLVAGGWGERRLQIVDVSTPSHPANRGFLEIADARSIVVSGRYAYVTDATYGLRIVDVGNPDEPRLAGSAQTVFDPNDGAGRVSVHGDHAYVAGYRGVRIIDIADPAMPFWVGSHNSDGGGIQDITVRRGVAYVSDGHYGSPTSLKLLDVRNPEIPVLIGKGPAGTGLQDIGHVAAGDTHAFLVASLESGIQELIAVDIRPSSGSYLLMQGRCRTAPPLPPPDPPDNGMAVALASRGDYLYALDQTEGLVIVCAANPAALTHESRLSNLPLHPEPNSPTTRPHAIVVSGNHAYISDLVQGLLVVRLF